MTLPPLTMNAAVLAPRQTLTATQQAALKRIAFLEGRRVKGGWRFGNDTRRYSLAVVDALKSRGLVHEPVLGFSAKLRLTPAGSLAVDKLQGSTRTRRQA